MDWDMTGSIFVQLLPPSWRGWTPSGLGGAGHARAGLMDAVRTGQCKYECVGGRFDILVSHESATGGAVSGASGCLPYGHFLLYAHTGTLVRFFHPQAAR